MSNLVAKHGPVPLPTKWAQRQGIRCGSKWVMALHADDELLTVEALAQLLKFPPSRVYGRCRECASDRLPHVKLGKYLRFHKSDQLVAVFLTRTLRPFGNCGYQSARNFYNGRESMRRLKREITGVGE